MYGTIARVKIDPIKIEALRALGDSMGGANITLEMNLSRDVDLAMQDVQSKVSQAQRHLPNDIEPPTISKSNPEDQPIMMVALSGPYPQRVLSDYMRYRLKEKLQTIPGVGEIQVGERVAYQPDRGADHRRADSDGPHCQCVPHHHAPAGLFRLHVLRRGCSGDQRPHHEHRHQHRDHRAFSKSEHDALLDDWVLALFFEV